MARPPRQPGSTDSWARLMTLTATLFVGGESRRMGQDKAGLVYENQPLWKRQLDSLRGLKPAALWISARVQPEWQAEGVEVVLDNPPGRGPLGGLVAALSHLTTSHLLALAVDLPRMSSEHLGELWSLASPGCGVIPQRGQRFEPLCAIYPAEAIDVVKDFALGADHSLRGLARRLLRQGRLEVYPVAEKDMMLYHNVNTPGDLESL